MPWTLFDTAIGPCGLAWSDEGVTCLQLPEETRARTRDRLLSRAGIADGSRATKTTPSWVTQAIDLARAHLDGRPQSFASIPLDLADVAPFATNVYRALQAVAAGSTVSYGALARTVGSPGASRAIGRAMATNPIPILIPCHRVLASEGKPGGFSAYGGVLTKERILALEGWTPPEPPLFAATRAHEEALPYDRAAATRHLAEVDRVLGAHVARVGELTLTLKKTDGVFGALAESIVYQQLSGKAAATIFGRVRALLPNGRLDPQALALAKDEELRAAGLSRSKLAAIRDLSARTAAGEIPTLAQLGRMDDDAIVDKLTEVRGIGRWTVEMLLIFRLGRPDVMPVADYGIKKGYARLFHRGKQRSELPTEADIARRAERWRPFRSVASWYLWRAADAGS
jgi:methylated-DNA-[protein]-cysteine S-methyltransferase